MLCCMYFATISLYLKRKKEEPASVTELPLPPAQEAQPGSQEVTDPVSALLAGRASPGKAALRPLASAVMSGHPPLLPQPPEPRSL